MRKFYTLTLLLSLSFSNLIGQSVDDLFQQRASLSRDYRNVASKYQALQLNTSKLATLRQQALPTMQLVLPFEDGQLKLQLKKVKITSEDFSVIEAMPDGSRRTVSYSGGVFYHGKIEGRANSFATLSLVNDQVVGIIADEKSNIVLGAIENNGRATNEYALYRETDLQVSNPMQCFTSEIPADGPLVHNDNHSGARIDAVGEPVDVYFECDNRFYQDKGSNTINVINYVLSFFNNTALLYANEDIKIQVSQILVWTTLDPEAAAGLNSTSACLTSFRDRMISTTYIGDYAHLLSTRNLGGGIAYLLNNPCSSSRQLRSAVSAINNTYNNFPTYSWTVEVVTHELGHNLGSNHTQWCGWVGGALDNCFTTEGGCPPGPAPTNGGTIMSYCHLTSFGINFNNGFGSQPGNKVRAVVGAAACFGTCRMTIEIAKQDASCGQNNGTATVTATNGTGALTYNWSNGQTGATLTNAAPGTYHVRVNDASGCQVMQVVTINNSGTALTFTLTPNGTAGFCTGGNITLTATNNPAYGYVWRRDGNIIAGAITNSHTTAIAGNYSVTVSSGACSGSQSVVLSEVAAPVANITAGGATTFCDGSSVVLNGNAGGSYTYQWYRNAAIISGATNPTYTATLAGNYTVKVSAGSACEVTSASIPVTVNASPNAVITAGTATSFCEGGNVNLSASTGAGYTYQWYRNNVLITNATQQTYSANTGGAYTVVTTVATCSRTSAATNVTVWLKPTITITPNVSTIEKFQTQVLNASGAFSYNWDVQPSVLSSGGNSATFRPLTTTHYTIEGTDVNGCKNNNAATINVIGCGDVIDITATAYSPSRVIVRWKNPQGATSDTLQYRKAGTTVWTRVFVTGEEYELNGLEPNTNYEYNIIPLCNTTTVYLPSPNGTFKTPSLNGRDYIRLYPNPVTAVSKLEIITSSSYTLQIVIFDNIGRKIKVVTPTENLPAGQVIKQIDSGILSNGIYNIAVIINGKTQNVKMIVMH